MCLFSTTPTRTVRGGVFDPPHRSSRYSSHTAGRMSGVAPLPRNSTTYVRRSSTSFVRDDPHVVEYRRSRERSRSRPREIVYEEYEAPRRDAARRRSRSVVRYEERGSRGSFVEDRRRSVSRSRVAY
ncbi:hypothetical protein B0J11DRAFT_129276 [Dendryphion nanum]|uniref:Uncharacterized protein n=1 Tax=Dendryphion nanum TaxID=256645 RepID=A0A9P9D9R6_9PLEO|nr:hypothetical protein B0J11DRAFT_129276 [Dendryphion nanum]